MGLEIGWYLRFTRGDVFEAQVDPGVLGQVEHALHIWPEWTLEQEELPDHVLVRFTRKKD